ncbi:hypothetical protein Vretifemale_11568 [Volvox reticuliferus]|uniref:Uncharacterized protein n=1 Tax=Volvox reticuliferus TaxID=1737510 RepID=A0A8J4FQ27_9CHLO|nr:hypothetical protein Vretifemale_11568 [Volvox reticuliferus]
MEAARGAGEVGPSGFRNLEPISREQREAARDKDFLEKSRLQARKRNVLQPPENFFGSPVVPERQAPSYCDEHDRFNRDVAGENYQRKQGALEKKEEVYATKRVVNYNREHGIKAADQAMEQREATKYETARAMGSGARRNQSGESYNIISLDYNRNNSGQALASKDSAYQERRQERAAHLHAKSHSVTHNIITGEPVKMPMPAKPH